MATVSFTYFTGLVGAIFDGDSALLAGSWDANGRWAPAWTRLGMQRIVAADGCTAFRATVQIADAERGKLFQWGVALVSPDGTERWAIPTETNDLRDPVARYREFRLVAASQEEEYYLTHCRRLGINKRTLGAETRAHFAVWAPNARSVEVVFAIVWDGQDPSHNPTRTSLPIGRVHGGYVAPDGAGIDESIPPVRLTRRSDGVWESDLADPALRSFADLIHRPFMYRVQQDDGLVTYRSDLYSRCQVGYGSFDPANGAAPELPYLGPISRLDGTVSCSTVVDPDQVTRDFAEQDLRWPETNAIPAHTFWADEFTDRPLPRRIEDLIIYKLHIGGLGFGSPTAGTLQNAMAWIDRLVALNVTAVELLPMCEFGGASENWGYATSHYFAIEYSEGGRDQYKHFIKACHRRGLAVIMDVVFNHYAHTAERAEYQYDSAVPERNIYYWYEGRSANYTRANGAARVPFPEGGYADNYSSAWAPRYDEEMVRKMFISSAAALVRDFHVDGLRFDQTTSIHGYNALHVDGRSLGVANQFGAKLLREMGRTLRMIKPELFLIAEDHSDFAQVTDPVEQGGMGFDARWYADFCHHLAGDTDKGDDYAKLAYKAATDPSATLRLDWLGGALLASADRKVVYVDSHDEAGNSRGPLRDPGFTDSEKEFTSHRAIVVSSNGAPLIGETRRFAEARCRFQWGVTVLSAGTPMLLFGEECGAVSRFKYSAVLTNREDLVGLGSGYGSNLMTFYGDINRLRLRWSGLRSRSIDVVSSDNPNRVIAFRRWDDRQSFLVIASLNDQPFDRGYTVTCARIEHGGWREVFNSDAARYGGNNVVNDVATLWTQGDSLTAVVPFAGFVVLAHERNA